MHKFGNCHFQAASNLTNDDYTTKALATHLGNVYGINNIINIIENHLPLSGGNKQLSLSCMCALFPLTSIQQ